MDRPRGTTTVPAPLLIAAALLMPSAILAAQAPPSAQQPPASSSNTPIAIVPVDAPSAAQAPTVTGALEVTAGKAVIAASGSVTSGSRTTDVVLPHRGTLRVCAATTVKLAADTGAPAGTTPGLLMAIDHGAVEMSFASTPAQASNADILLTPDFRILISGPGASEVKVRLGQQGDTCVDNSGANAPYVVVTSVFDSGLYRVQPGQRVMFQHGSLNEVVDQEKEPCGCPAQPAHAAANEFPLAQSEGLAPSPAPAPAPPQATHGEPQSALVYSAKEHAPTAAIPAPAPQAAPAPVHTPAPAPPPAPVKKKHRFLAGIGHFFRRFFGVD